MAYDVNEVVKKYIELRDARDVESKAFAETQKIKYGDPMETIEKWLLTFMEQNGLDNVKTPSGTPYKNVTKSVKMSDSAAFKRMVFSPLIDALAVPLSMDSEQVFNLLTNGILWDMIDFRAGKKGIVEYAEENGKVPDGVTLDQFTTINIRRA